MFLFDLILEKKRWSVSSDWQFQYKSQVNNNQQSQNSAGTSQRVGGIAAFLPLQYCIVIMQWPLLLKVLLLLAILMVGLSWISSAWALKNTKQKQ